MSERWVTFDCYGTMVDWRTGMVDALEGVVPGRSADLVDAYHRFEPVVEAELPFRKYRAVLAEGLRRAAESIQIPLVGAQFHVLAATLSTWPAFPDSVAALEQLRADGYSLGILSNVDVDLIRGTLAGPLPVPFDDVITAEEVRSYKPGGGLFDEFLTRYAPDRSQWIHVGSSLWHDCEPAHDRGFRTVLIDRSGMPTDAGCATLVLPDLAALPAGLRELG